MDDKLTPKEPRGSVGRRPAGDHEGNPHVEPLHLLAALVSQEGGIAAPLLRAAGADPAAVLRSTEDQIARLPKPRVPRVSAPDTARPLSLALATAAKRAREMGDEYVSTEHLLVGLATDGGQAADVLRKAGAGPDELLGAFEKVRGHGRVTTENPEGDLPGPGEVRDRPDPAGP